MNARNRNPLEGLHVEKSSMEGLHVERTPIAILHVERNPIESLLDFQSARNKRSDINPNSLLKW